MGAGARRRKVRYWLASKVLLPSSLGLASWEWFGRPRKKAAEGQSDGCGSHNMTDVAMARSNEAGVQMQASLCPAPEVWGSRHWLGA